MGPKKSSWSSSRKKHYNKRTIHNASPHVECIQDQLRTLEAELSRLVQADSENSDLTTEQKIDIETKKASIKTLKETLKRFQEEPWKSKISAYSSAHSRRGNEKHEAMILKILQFFYFVRLGQYNLFSIVPGPPEISNDPNKDFEEAFRSLCDQIVGAAVHEALPSTRRATREMEKEKVFELLRKLETNSSECVLATNQAYPNADTKANHVTFRDIQAYMQHIWDNTKHEKTLRGELSAHNQDERDDMMTDHNTALTPQMDTKVADTNERSPPNAWAVLQCSNMMEPPIDNKFRGENIPSKIPQDNTVMSIETTSDLKYDEDKQNVNEPQQTHTSEPQATAATIDLSPSVHPGQAGVKGANITKPGEVDTKEQLETKSKNQKDNSLTETTHQTEDSKVQLSASQVNSSEGWGDAPTETVIDNWNSITPPEPTEEYSWNEFNTNRKHKEGKRWKKKHFPSNKSSVPEINSKWGVFVDETMKKYVEEHSPSSSVK